MSTTTPSGGSQGHGRNRLEITSAAFRREPINSRWWAIRPKTRQEDPSGVLVVALRVAGQFHGRAAGARPREEPGGAGRAPVVGAAGGGGRALARAGSYWWAGCWAGRPGPARTHRPGWRAGCWAGCPARTHRPGWRAGWW